MRPTDPTRLPGDNPPPRGRMGPPPGGMPGGKPPPEPESDAPGPSLDIALQAAQAAIKACAADGYKVGVSVLDSSGQPRASLSADGASGGHVYTGARKALAALEFKKPTSQIGNDSASQARLKPNMAGMAGAVPLIIGNTTIGAIGVSGASGMQDEKCAVAGAASVHSLLK